MYYPWIAAGLVYVAAGVAIAELGLAHARRTRQRFHYTVTALAWPLVTYLGLRGARS